MPDEAKTSWLTTRGAELAAALTFYTRLPAGWLPAASHSAPDFTRISWAVPVAGAIIGAIGASVLALMLFAGMGDDVSAALAVLVMIVATGAFHEDGLADTADSLGGMTWDKRLEIMRDSRIGTFGACALILVTGLRVLLIADIAWRGLLPAAFILIAAEAASRSGALWLGHALDPARSDGAAFAAGRFAIGSVLRSGVAAALIVFVLAASAVGVTRSVIALTAVIVVALAMTAFARRIYGGQTGDVAGATQQLALIAFLAVMASG